MICATANPPNPALRRYNRRCLVAMAFYSIGILVTSFAKNRLHSGNTLAAVLAALTALPMVAVIVIVGLYLKEQTDEFQRELLIQTLLWAVACTFTTTSVWGLLEMFSGIPRLPAFYVFVLFWMFFGLVSIPLRIRYRTGGDE